MQCAGQCKGFPEDELLDKAEDIWTYLDVRGLHPDGLRKDASLHCAFPHQPVHTCTPTLLLIIYIKASQQPSEMCP